MKLSKENRLHKQESDLFSFISTQPATKPVYQLTGFLSPPPLVVRGGQYSILHIRTNCQSWALALFFQVRSPLIFYPWIAIALSLILPIFRFAHRLIALKKPVVRSCKRSLKRLITPKTTAVCSYVCMPSKRVISPSVR